MTFDHRLPHRPPSSVVAANFRKCVTSRTNWKVLCPPRAQEDDNDQVNQRILAYQMQIKDSQG